MTICSKCGAQNTDGAAFCNKCGMQLQSARTVVNNYYYGRLRRRDRRRLSQGGQGVAPAVFAEKEVIKEVVLVPCSYCGSLMPQTSIVCPHCGATRKA
ncbi:MAG: zinc ribbon domain-containing protein [Candidatus Bathyarchaeia archaeon]